MKFFFLLLTTLLLANSSVVRAQSDKDIAILKSQSLVVVLKDEEPTKLKKLANKPSELKEYKAFIADYNSLIQELTPKIWNFSPSVEFKHESEMSALLKNKSYQHGVLQHDNFTVFTRTMGSSAGATYFAESQTAFSIGIVNNGTRRSIGQVPIAPGVVHTSDIIFCLKGLQYQLQQRARGMSGKDQMAELAQNGQKLRAKILLIDEAEIKNSLTAADIKQAYPFPYQVVPRETIETAVKDADARYACVRLFPFSGNSTVQVVMDVADGAILVMSMPGGLSMKSGNAVDKNNLKSFAQAANGK